MAMSLGTKVLNTVVLTLKQRNNIHGNVCWQKVLNTVVLTLKQRNNIHGYACEHISFKHSRSHFKKK